MNRQIKFRVWTGERFIYEGFLVSPSGAIHGTTRFDMNDTMHTLNVKDSGKLKDSVLQQFTGLLDKNGKEIFEGDICECLYDTGRKRLQVVELEYGAYLKERFYAGGMGDFEVIGNIFQNPELIK